MRAKFLYQFGDFNFAMAMAMAMATATTSMTNSHRPPRQQNRNLKQRLDAVSSSRGPHTANSTLVSTLIQSQVRFPNMTYKLNESLNHSMFKDMEIPLLLTEYGVVHVTSSGYKLHDILFRDDNSKSHTNNETYIVDDYVDGLPIYVNTNYRETDIIDREFSHARTLTSIPYIHTEIMLYRSYYRLNEKSNVVMVIERLHKKHHIHDVYFIVNGDIMNPMVREDINAFLMDLKEYE